MHRRTWPAVCLALAIAACAPQPAATHLPAPTATPPRSTPQTGNGGGGGGNTATPTPQPTVSTTSTPVPVGSATPVPSVAPGGEPSAAPSFSPSPTPSATSTPAPSPSASPSPTPTPTPSAVQFEGRVATFAGYIYSGDADGLGLQARMKEPEAVACDSQGNVYVADTFNNKIRKVTPDGQVTTLAGNGATGFADGPGAMARFYYPGALAVDAAGTVYVADTGNHRIRKITPDGTVSTLAGSEQGGSLDGQGAAARFDVPDGIALGPDGNLYVCDGADTIRRVTPDGTVTTYAGSGSTGGYREGPADTAQFNWPHGIVVAADGTIYVAEQVNNRIRMISPGRQVSTLAGSMAGHADGPGVEARFDHPYGLTLDPAGWLYVCDSANQCIRRINLQDATHPVTTLAGSVYGYQDGTFAVARFYNPFGLALDGRGHLYVADYSNNCIRQLR